MRRPTAALILLLALLLPLAAAAQDETAAPAPPAANQVELRLEQRLLSLDLLAYNQTRDQERAASQRVAGILGRLDQALASDSVSLGALESLQDELALARGAAHAAEDKLNDRLGKLQERLRRIALLEGDTGAPARAADPLTGRWRVAISPQNATATFELHLDGTVVSGLYSIDGGTAGSFRGTLSNGNLRLERIDAQGGIDSVWTGTLANGRIAGTWMSNELVTGQPNRGDWTAVREGQ
ncbi:MAG TPA: hypothetical protein VGP73_12930 [Thermoanaerobaculia bacterium]